MAEIKKLTVRLPRELEPKFVNMARVTHTPGEFVLDFSAILPGEADPKVDVRLVLAPLGAKLLQQALDENVRRYESIFGEIKLPGGGRSLAEDLFKDIGPNPPENE